MGAPARLTSVLAPLVGVVALLPSAPARVARLVHAGPALTLDTALADVIALVGAAATAYLCLTAVLLVVLDVVAPRSRALRLAMRLTPARWRRLVLATTGVAVVVAGATPAVSAPAHVASDQGRPDLSGLRLPDRPESPAPVAAPVPSRTTTSWVRVQPGDCLWDLARHELPAGASTARVARSVDAWHQANRGRIGPDPDLLLPGTRLRQPASDPRDTKDRP